MKHQYPKALVGVPRRYGAVIAFFRPWAYCPHETLGLAAWPELHGGFFSSVHHSPSMILGTESWSESSLDVYSQSPLTPHHTDGDSEKSSTHAAAPTPKRHANLHCTIH